MQDVPTLQLDEQIVQCFKGLRETTHIPAKEAQDKSCALSTWWRLDYKITQQPTPINLTEKQRKLIDQAESDVSANLDEIEEYEITWKILSVHERFHDPEIELSFSICLTTWEHIQIEWSAKFEEAPSAPFNPECRDSEYIFSKKITISDHKNDTNVKPLPWNDNNVKHFSCRSNSPNLLKRDEPQKTFYTSLIDISPGRFQQGRKRMENVIRRIKVLLTSLKIPDTTQWDIADIVRAQMPQKST